MVYYPYSMYHKDIGNVIHLNEKAFQLNNIDTSIFESYTDLESVPIILSNQFYGVYYEGDIIVDDKIDYIVAKVLKPNEVMKVLGPVGFAEQTSEVYSFALFDNKFIARDLRIGNNNFLHSIFFYNLDLNTIQEIREYITESNLKYSILSINEIQKEYFSQKMIAVSGYFLVGMISFLFSIIGFICAIYVDVLSKEVEYSVMKIVGYSNKEIILRYLIGILGVVLVSYICGLILSYLFLGFSIIVSAIVLMIVLVVSVLLSIISYRLIKSISSVEVIGGINA